MTEELYITPERRAEINQRKTLLERRKLASNSSMSLEEMIERANTQRLNRNELIRLMQEYGFTIRAIDFPNWRPTKRDSGSIPGVRDTVEIIATDGLLGYFIEGEEVLIGHTHMFTGDVKPLFSVPKNGQTKPRKPKQKTKRQLILESI